MVSTLFILGLAAPVMASTSSALNPGILIAAYNYDNPIQSKNTAVNMTVLFHSDLHSELLPWPLADYNATGTNDDPTVGGMARIATKINEIRIAKDAIAEPVLVFDDGDFLMGTPFEWLGGDPVPKYASAELLLMSSSLLDYTATCLGNHEFDYSDHGLSGILNNTNSTLGGNMPLILCSNLDMTNDYYNLGAFIQPNATMIVNGVTIGLFSVIGYGANGTMFFKGHYNILDPITTAQQQVNYLKANVPDLDLIICLSHSGWKEDVALAQQVDGIDLILAGHDHDLLTTPKIVSTPSGTTTIVDAGALGEYLGYLEMTMYANNSPGQGITVRKYDPIHINDSIAENPTIATAIGTYTGILNAFLGGFGLPWNYNTVIANTTYPVPSAPVTPGYIASYETAIGDMIADANRWQITDSTGDYINISFVPSGVIRHGFNAQSGNITFYDAVSVVPLGGIPYGGGIPMGLPYMGWFLCNFSLYGSEIKTGLEFSVYMGGDFFLQVSGLKFTYTDWRLPGTKVQEVWIENQGGGWTALNDTQLYSVVVNLEAALLIPEIGAMSGGYFVIQPKFPNGTVIPTADPAAYLSNVLYIDPGFMMPVPEWLALVNYLSNPNGLNGTVPDYYNSSQDRIHAFVGIPEYLLLLGGAQSLLSQQTASNWTIGGIGVLLLIMIIAVAVILSRRP